jgi:type II secretory pathway component PulM
MILVKEQPYVNVRRNYMEHIEHRLKVLEQKLTVMQKEVSEVIGELQQAMTALMRSQAMATAVTNSRLEELESKTLNIPIPADNVHIGGKEL